MRVISGKFKGKKLIAPKDDNVRPTTDRIKETIFNILCNKIELEDADILDLFCGSGALGIEALSRGARRAVFIDNSPDSIRLAKQNLTQMDKVIIAVTLPKHDLQQSNKDSAQPDFLSNTLQNSYCRAEIFNADFQIAIKKLKGEKFDIIFIDPPYFDNLGESSINLIEKYDILAENGIIVYEHYGKKSLSINQKKFIMDTRNFGSVSVSFLTNAKLD